MKNNAAPMPAARVEAARSASAYTRAWSTDDMDGAFLTFLLLSPEQRLEFAAAQAFLTTLALEVGEVPQDEFWAAVNAVIEKEAGDPCPPS